MLQAENVLFTIVLIGYFAATILNFAFVILKKEKIAKAALILQTVILVLHTAVLVLRGIGAKRWPMTNQYEFAVSFAWALCLVSLIFIRKYKFPVLGAFATPLILLMIGYASMQSREVRELMPSLRSSWLAFHVSTAIIAYGAFGVACVLSLIFLLRGRMKEDGFWDQLPKRFPGDAVSDADDPDRRDLGGTGLGQLLELGSEGNLVPGDLDHLRDISAPSAAQGLEGEGGRVVRGHRLRVRNLYLYRGEHLPARHSQLRIRKSDQFTVLI